MKTEDWWSRPWILETMSPTSVEVSNQTPDRASKQGHQRAYQACIPCRQRKVKCDLGEPDNPSEPPCARCRREGKSCYFSQTRRRRKGEEDDYAIEAGAVDYEIQNGRKRIRTDSNDPMSALQSPFGFARGYHDSHSPQPLTPGGARPRSQPLKRPTAEPSPVSDEEDRKVSNDTAAIIQQSQILTGHDALHLLYEAADRNGDIKTEQAAANRSLSGSQAQNGVGGPSPAGSRPKNQSSHHSVSAASLNHDSRNQAAELGSTTGTGPVNSSSNIGGLEAATNAWSRCKFVYEGWFSATDAIEMVNYFYTHLSPLTPITLPDFQSPMSHPKLLSDEPLLTVTILALASRFIEFSGHGGTVSRPYAIHHKLSTYLQGTISRMIWGQEQWGGGFCGAGLKNSAIGETIAFKGLRSIGSIEALLLLTEWHTRNLHFPPGGGNGELMLPDFNNDDAAAAVNGQDVPTHPETDVQPGVGGPSRRVHSWLEPCWRSDRMCWSLLANAMALAHELQIFERPSNIVSNDSDSPGPVVESSFRRRQNVKRLLYVYMELISGRLGLKSMLPDSHSDSFIGVNPLRIAGLLGKRKPLDDSVKSKQLKQDAVLYFWCGLAAIFQRGNAELFPTIKHTKEVIRTETYTKVLQQIGAVLASWKRDFDECQDYIPDQLRYIILVEYEYSRVYINNVALQSVVNRAINSSPGRTYAQMASAKGPNERRNSVIPFRNFVNHYGQDQPYINEVREASQNLLQLIAQGLDLKHAPVRTYFRIISVCMVLLKTFVVGAPVDNAKLSFSLMSDASRALMHCVVDDVHVGNRIGAMLGTLTSRVKHHMIRMTSSNVESSSRVSRAPTPSAAAGLSNGAAAQDGTYPAQGSVQQQSYFQPQWGNNSNFFSMTQSEYNTQLPFQSLSQNDPLYGIPTDLFDPSNSDVMIMAPPNYPMQDSSGFDGTGGGAGAFGSLTQPNGTPGLPDPTSYPGQDWVTMRLDKFVNEHGQEVTPTVLGPNVGGYDMLDYLT